VRALPSYAEALALPHAPPLTVPTAYGDGNGHLNVRHYVGILDDAEWTLFDEFGAGTAASQAGVGGMFALEAHLTYRREVLVGDEVAVHVRILDRTSKLLHLVSYLLNRSRGEVSASMEALEAYVDYGTRRAAPFPAAAGAALDAIIQRNRALPWRPELSGSIALPAQS
jgi:acyl-CoA thioester hydrolase